MGKFKSMSMDNDCHSYTMHYLQFFGDSRYQIVELLPPGDGISYDREHEQITGLGCLPGEPLNPIEEPLVADEIDNRKHICWCEPELIYADDDRGNEVWLHKRVN